MQSCILSYNNRAEVLELPVPLQGWNVESPHSLHSFTTIESGEVLAIGKKKLKTMSITSFFPAKEYPFLITKDIKEPFQCVEMINKWKESNKPIRVVIVGTDVNLAMGIESFSYGRSDGDGSGDVAFVLELTEYSFLNTPRSKVESKKTELSERPEEKIRQEGTTHNVQKGDTMWDMAEKYLGDGNRWREIAEINGMKDGWDLKVGVDIKIPPRDIGVSLYGDTGVSLY